MNFVLKRKIEKLKIKLAYGTNCEYKILNINRRIIRVMDTDETALMDDGMYILDNNKRLGMFKNFIDNFVNEKTIVNVRTIRLYIFTQNIRGKDYLHTYITFNRDRMGHFHIAYGDELEFYLKKVCKVLNQLDMSYDIKRKNKRQKEIKIKIIGKIIRKNICCAIL